MFGQTVRAHRQRLGMTQEELARATGVSVRNIRNIEAGGIRVSRPSTVRLLAKAFGLEAAERDRFYHSAFGQAPRDGAAAQAATDRWQHPVPAQLPPKITTFTGRNEQLRRLTALLEADHQATVVMSAISGTAGVGKTALAVTWAHQVANRFPDGQLYVNLRGFDPGGSVMSPGQAIRGFLDAFAVPAERIPASEQAQAALYRSLLAGRRVLVILDNAHDADQVRPLLPGAPGCCTVITSRHQLTSLIACEAARPLTVDLLSVGEAHQVLANRLGGDRVKAEPEATREIITRCAGLPLALAIAAAHAATNPQLPLAALANQLRDTRHTLNTLATHDASADLRAAFSCSYRVLSTGAARLFRLLGLHPGPEISAAAAASLAATSPERARSQLAELTRAQLINEDATHRYTFHDLLRVYAAELASTDDTPANRQAALHRLFDHYLHTTHAASRILAPHRQHIALPPAQPGVVTGNPEDSGQATEWFTTEQQVLFAVIREAANSRFNSHAWQLAFTQWIFLNRQGHWHDWITNQHIAIAAAENADDTAGQANARYGLGLAYIQVGRYEDADIHLRHALALYGALGDHYGQGLTHRSLARVAERQDRNDEALTHALQHLDHFRAIDDTYVHAQALNVVGWYYAQVGRYQQAIALCQQALGMQQARGDRSGEAFTWDSIGYAHHHLGDYPQAVTSFHNALAGFRSLGHRYQEADTLTHLGDTHQAAGNPGAAIEAWQQSLTILNELNHPDADDLLSKLHNLVHSPNS